MTKPVKALKKTAGFNSFYPKVKVINRDNAVVIFSGDSISLNEGEFVLEPSKDGFGVDFDFITYSTYLIKYPIGESNPPTNNFDSWRTTYGSDEDVYLVLEGYDTTLANPQSSVTLISDESSLNYPDFYIENVISTASQSTQPVIVDGVLKFITADQKVISVNLTTTNLTQTDKYENDSLIYFGDLWTNKYGIIIDSIYQEDV